jgi:hypothetical protein
VAQFGRFRGKLRRQSGQNVQIALLCHKAAIIWGGHGVSPSIQSCSKEQRFMRKIILAAVAGAAALTLAACSEKTEDAATETADSAAADASVNADAAGEAAADVATDAAATASDAAATASTAATDAAATTEAAAQGESTDAAMAD